MMMRMKIHTKRKYCGNVSMQQGHWLDHAWMLGHGEPDALFGGTVALLSNSKQKEGSWAQTHTALGLASTADTGYPAFGCEMTDYKWEQSQMCVTSPALTVQFSSVPTQLKSEPPLNLMRESPLVLVLIFNFHQSLQDYGYLFFSSSMPVITITCCTWLPNSTCFAKRLWLTFNLAFPQKKERK